MKTPHKILLAALAVVALLSQLNRNKSFEALYVNGVCESDQVAICQILDEWGTDYLWDKELSLIEVESSDREHLRKELFFYGYPTQVPLLRDSETRGYWSEEVFSDALSAHLTEILEEMPGVAQGMVKISLPNLPHLYHPRGYSARVFIQKKPGFNLPATQLERFRVLLKASLPKPGLGNFSVFNSKGKSLYSWSR